MYRKNQKICEDCHCESPKSYIDIFFAMTFFWTNDVAKSTSAVVLCIHTYIDIYMLYSVQYIYRYIQIHKLSALPLLTIEQPENLKINPEDRFV